MQITLGIRIFEIPLTPKDASSEARRLLADMLADAGISLEAPLPLEKDENGRPFLRLPQYRDRIDFNLSHAGSLVVCAIAIAEKATESPRVGVDVETPHKHLSPERIAKRFFHPAELASLKAKDFSEHAFLGIWTKKEAYLKFKGTGLSGGMRNADTTRPEMLDPPARLASYPVKDHPSAHLTLALPLHAPAPKSVRIYD